MPNPSTTHDEAAQAELIRKRREMRRAYATPEVEPVQFIRPECVGCDGTLYPENRSPRRDVCSRCYEEMESDAEAGFWSWPFVLTLLVVTPFAVGVAWAIGWVAWRMFQ